MKVIRFPLLFCLSSLFFCYGSGAQDLKRSEVDVGTLPLDERIAYLGERDGLEKGARRYHRLLVEDRTYGIVDPTLEGLVADSLLIVKGKMVDRMSRLVDQGEQIVTDCTLDVEGVIKGVLSTGRVKFRVKGGTVEFPGGDTAEIRTDASEFFQLGRTYVVMLIRDPNTGELVLTHHVAAVLGFKNSGKVIDSLSAHNSSSHHVREATDSRGQDEVLSRIRSLAPLHK
jgi:hypothetical protein